MGLIEVIVGLGLLAVGIIGMNSLVVSMMRGNLSAQLTDQATRLASAKIAELRSVSYDKVAVGTTADKWWSAATGSSIVFERTTTVAAGTLAATRAITVTLRWYDRGMRTTTFASEIAQ
ncbi:MAG: type IV pilus modification PilV family protein [Candidatus Binatia bacterium]